MEQQLFDPIPISYRGLYADDHIVDAQQFGESIQGASKIANSIAHWFFFGEITHDPRAYQIRFFVGPSKQNGLLQEITAVVASGQLPAFSPILMDAAKPVIEWVFTALLEKLIKRESEAQVAIEAMRDLAMKHAEFSSQVHEGHMRDKAWLQQTVDRLAIENRSAARILPEPVGKTVRDMKIGSFDEAIVIDAPSAEVLRSRENLEVGETTQYTVQIEGVFKTNGACRLKLLDQSGQVVAGKVVDPVLRNPNNIYTRSLNDGRPLRVTAKPTLKDGHIARLFISDAAPAS